MVGGATVLDERRARNIDFTPRLVDQFFRRWIWYVLPVVLLAIVGVRAASNVSQDFVSRGTLSASSNPLVDTPEVRGGSIGAFESPAAGITRLINEQLRSDAFVEGIADRAGLASALESGLISTAVIRQQVSANAQGENLLTVQASWSDPETAFQLVDATINNYLDLVSETVAIDSVEAIDFWTGIQSAAQQRADEAEANLRAYTQALPELAEGEQRAPEQEFELSRLNATLDEALGGVSSAQNSIDAAKLNVDQSKSQAGRQLRVIDPPQVAAAPESSAFEKLSTVALFTLLGLLISGLALVVTTLADHSVRSTAQLELASGVGSTTIVPRSKLLRRPRQAKDVAA